MKKTILFAVVAALVFCLCHSCTSPRYIPIETTKTEYRDNYIRDSIFRYDSVYIKEKSDTLIIERHQYRYQYKNIRDSIHITDTIKVPYPVEVIKEVKKPLTGWQNFQLWCGRIAIIAVLFFIIYVLQKLKRKCLF